MRTTNWILPALLLAPLATAQDADSVEAAEPDLKIPKLMKHEDVSGAKVRSTAGAEIGDVTNAIIDLESGTVLMAIVSTGGFLGIGDSHTAVPCEAMTWKRTKAHGCYLVLDVDKKALAGAPKFETGKLAKHFADSAWRKETAAAFGTYPESAVLTPVKGDGDGKSEKAKSARFVLASEIFGCEVRTRLADRDDGPSSKTRSKTRSKTNKGLPFGSVKDVLIAPGERKVSYVLVEKREGGGNFIVPFEAFDRCHDGGMLLNKRAYEMSDAPKLEKDAVARLANEAYCKRIRGFYLTSQ